MFLLGMLMVLGLQAIDLIWKRPSYFQHAARCTACNDGFAWNPGSWCPPPAGQSVLLCRNCGAASWQKAVGHKMDRRVWHRPATWRRAPAWEWSGEKALPPEATQRVNKLLGGTGVRVGEP